MAGTGLLAILDDITTLLDDVAAMSKLAAKKTIGIVGDDLAVNANAVVGIDPKRELPIVGKIFLGSLVNKAVLIPIALAIPAAAVTPLLMFGGAYLCYEAFHKMTHKKDAKDEEHHQKMLEAIKASPDALAKLENKKVWQAILTDTILSAEIIAVTLGAVAVGATLAVKAATLTLVGVGVTVGVYGIVAGIVKLDDIGLHLQKAEGDSLGARFKRGLGRGLVDYTPDFMKTLSVVGTAAMFAVGGGILAHGIPAVHHFIEGAIGSGGFISGALEMGANIAIGIGAGLAASPVFKVLGKGIDAVKKPFMSLVNHFKKKLPDTSVTKKDPPAPSLELKAAGTALASVPKVKNDLAAAAEKRPSVSAPAVDIDKLMDKYETQLDLPAKTGTARP